MGSRLLKWLRNYFGFSKTETYGVIVIHLAILLMLISPIILEYFLVNRIHPKDLELVEVTSESPKEVLPKTEKKDSLFKFDPNTISADDLSKLGLPDFLANRISKYRLGGGVFNSPSDLYRIYGIDSGWVQKVSTFVQIENKIIAQKSNNFAPRPNSDSGKPNAIKEVKIPIKLDLNLVDTLELMKVRGIGRVLSNRIIKFRESLGGFHSMSQLIEVYGLEEEVISKVQEKFLIEEDFTPRKLVINSCPREELETHPYLTRKDVELIINYRSNHVFTSMEDLNHIPTLDSSRLSKLVPYLSFDK